MLLIGKANWHTTVCILDFIMLLLGSLTSVTGNSLLLASCSNMGLSRWKLHAFRILTRNSESASNSASDDVWPKRVWEKKIFDGPGVPYRCKTAGKKWKSFFDRKKYLILLRISRWFRIYNSFSKIFWTKKWPYRYSSFSYNF